MSSTVLGKRTRVVAGMKQESPVGHRTAAYPSREEPTSDTTCIKRRITLNGPNDENENPFVTSKHEDSVEGPIDLDAVRPTKKTRSGRKTVPVKHGEPEARLDLSPGKTDQRAATAAIDVYQDGRIDRNPTPKTPRHRDALSKRVPITPRHRVLVAGNQFTPRSPKTPRTPSNGTTRVYNEARQIFSRCSDSGKLVGRDSERAELSAFVQTCISSKCGGCLYVSGPPGTGKSAFVGEALQETPEIEDVSTSMINCMSVRKIKDLSQKLVEDLGLAQDTTFDDLGSLFVRTKAQRGKKYLVILDEVDQLVDLDLSALYSLFEWSMHANSQLVLIGIANALDLTDRFLPRLKSRNLRPQLLPFLPYTASQITAVITSKLKGLSAAAESPALPFLQPAAIQFCAKKVAGQTGDLRKAFDICRRAIDLIEQETRNRDEQETLQNSPSKAALMENMNLSSPLTPLSPTKQITAYTINTAPKATIAHMARITAQVFSNGATQRLSNLNLQQKAVLCALAALEKHTRDPVPPSSRLPPSTPSKRPTAPSVKELFEAYSALCRRDGLLHPLSSLEFRDVVSGLETLSLLVPADAKNRGFAAPITPSRTPGRKPSMPALTGDGRRVASAVGWRELMLSLEGPGSELLREIMEAGL